MQASNLKMDCLCCGKSFKIYPYQVDKKKFCSLSCKKEYNKKNRQVCFCSVCGKQYELRPCEMNKGSKFCSFECRVDAQKGKGAWNKGLTKETHSGMLKISELNKGKHHSEESKLKNRLAHLGVTKDKNPNLSNGRKGLTKETCESIQRQSEKLLGRTKENTEYLKRISEFNKNKKLSEETKLKISTALKGRKASPQERENNRLSKIKKWQEPGYKERVLPAMIKGSQQRPNKLEKKVISLLDEILPEEYKYVGDGSLMIRIADRCVNPDFINIKGQKKIIEVFGDYWHKPNPEERETLQDLVDERRILFLRGGYMTWVIWEHEVINEIEEVKRKLIWFNETIW